MASNMESKTIKLSSHNIRGFSNSDDFLYSRCDSENDSIFALQEHWLKPHYRKQQGVSVLKTLHPNFDGHGTSGMTERIES